MAKLSRQAFIEAYGASCNNWRNSWSFVNHAEQFVIFGAWDQRLLEDGSGTVVFSAKWFTNSKGNKHGSYDRSREHIRLIEEEGYALRTFPMEYSDEDHDENGNGPAKIGSWKPVLSYATLRRVNDDWVALTHDVVPMPKGMYPESEEKRVTEKDIILAELIFPILLDAVENEDVLTYGDVTKAVKKKYPDNAAAQSLVPVIVGRRLGVIWRFTQGQGCPHIGSLVINQHTNECGEGITSLLDPEAERQKVYAYPWNDIQISFKSHLEKERANRRISKKKLKRKKRPDAMETFFEYFYEQEKEEGGMPVEKDQLGEHRDRIIELVMEGHEPETAFGLVLADLVKKKRLPIKERDGFVYIGHYVVAGTDDPLFDQIKIGYTTLEPSIRAKQISGGVLGPLEFKVINFWKMNSGLMAYAAEQALHGEFSLVRQNGEFFDGHQGWLVDSVEEIMEQNHVDSEVQSTNKTAL